MTTTDGTDRRRAVEHQWQCWEHSEGAGHQIRAEVGEMKKRIWLWQGAILLVAALGPTVLGIWLSYRLTSAEHNAIQRDSSAVIFRQAHAAEPRP